MTNSIDPIGSNFTRDDGRLLPSLDQKNFTNWDKGNGGT
jgi:hypothetical protein